MKVLTNNIEFHWYKKKLDFDRTYEHNHEGEPKEYPCKVSSRLDNVSDYSSSYGATDIYYHSFVYKETVKCAGCGHTSEEWPSKQAEKFIDDNVD